MNKIVMRNAVASRVERLRQLDLAAIKQLPQQLTEAVPSLRKLSVTQYHDVTNEGGHRVVVQAVRERWLGLFTAIEVDGFVVDSGGIKRALREPEKWPYT